MNGRAFTPPIDNPFVVRAPGELAEAAETYVKQVSEAVATDEETSAYVEELERRSEMLEAEEALPSGDTIAAELTRFLREREREDGGSEEHQGPTEPD